MSSMNVLMGSLNLSPVLQIKMILSWINKYLQPDARSSLRNIRLNIINWGMQVITSSGGGDGVYVFFPYVASFHSYLTVEIPPPIQTTNNFNFNQIIK